MISSTSESDDAEEMAVLDSGLRRRTVSVSAMLVILIVASDVWTSEKKNNGMELA